MTVKDTVKDTAERATTFANDTLATAGDKLTAVGDKLHDAAGHLRDGAGAARAAAGDTLDVVRDKAATAFDAAKEKSGNAYDGARDYASIAAEAARDKANAAYATARETASTVRTRAADGIEESPIVALIGGIAIGVLLGALIPRSQREEEALGPIGDKLSTLAKNALAAAKEAGKDTLDELGVNKDAARQQVNSLIDSAGKAASSAGSAAADAIRSPTA